MPDPEAEHVAPAVATQVQVAPVNAAGSESATTAPVTADGPLLDATMVYVTLVPGTSVIDPSVLVMARSAWGPSESVSVAELLPAIGSVTVPGAVMVAELINEPVAEASTVAFNVYVAVAPTARLMVSLMEPVPLAVHVAPAVATHVQVAPVKAAGSESATTAPVTADGPLLDATIV